MQHEVRVASLDDARLVQRIEGFVAEHGASLFHRPTWLQAIEAGTGQRAVGFVAQRLGVITGWLPLTEVRSVLFGKALVSSGFGVGGGLIASSPEAEIALLEAGKAHAVANGFASLELRGGHAPRARVGAIGMTSIAALSARLRPMMKQNCSPSRARPAPRCERV